MINIINKQRKIIINKAKLEKDIVNLLKVLKYSDFDISLVIVDDSTMRKYNREYRNKDKTTDVLSFPFWPNLKPGMRINAITDDDKNLGDLIISAPYVVKEAQKYGITFDERMRVLIIHGICHLLGYDHIIDADFRRMRAKEARLLKKLISTDKNNQSQSG